MNSTFIFNRTKGYLFEPENIFYAIDKLKIDKDYIIVTIGVNFQKYEVEYKIKGLEKALYKGIPIINLPGSRSFNQMFFILKKVNLPSLFDKDIEPDIITKYSLRKISDNFNFYASLIDLNKCSDEIRKENLHESNEEDLRKSVLLCIIYNIEIRWKKNIELIQIDEYSEFMQKGLPNKLDEIVPLKN